MTLTYPEQDNSTATNAADFVPAYARKSTRRKPVRSWMILAPVGAIVLLGAGASLIMAPAEPASPLAESAPLATPPVTQNALTADSETSAAGMATGVTPSTAETGTMPMSAAPAAARPPIAAASSPARSVDRPGAERATQAARVTPSSEAPAQVVTAPSAEPTGPRPYQSESATPDPIIVSPQPSVTGPATPQAAPAVAPIILQPQT